MNKIEDAFKILERRTAVTSAARFNASQRVQLRATLALWAITAMSTYVIALSLISIIVPNAKHFSTEIAVGNLSLSMLVLILSIIETMRDRGKSAHVFHACGLRIREVQNAVSNARLSDQMTNEDLLELQEQYDRVLRETDLNHAEIDILGFEISRGIARDSARERIIGWGECLWKRSQYYRLWVYQFAFYWACILCPLLLAYWIGVYSADPNR